METTIKVDKEIIGKLHGVKGHLTFINPPKKYTLNDAIKFLIDDYYKRNMKG